MEHILYTLCLIPRINKQKPYNQVFYQFGRYVGTG